MNPELKNILDQLKKAKCCEDVFGKLDPLDRMNAGKKLYRRFAKVAHADKYTDPKDKKAANDAFVLLSKWWDEAESKINADTYGNRKVAAGPTTPVAITVQSKLHVYAVTGLFASGDLSDIYAAEFADKGGSKKVLVKVVKSPKNNDLMAAERVALDALAKVKEAKHRVPEIVESVTIQDATGAKRSANIFEFLPDLVPLDDILDALKMAPIDPRDVAWMGSRLWTNLAVVHSAGFVHGAVHPEHCLICAENHGMVLTDWCYSVKIGETIKAISPKFKALYPPEVFAKKPANQATDIYMAAFTLTILLGGVTNTPSNPVFPAGVPIEMQRFLKACLLPGQTRRPDSAHEMADEWKKLLGKLFGKPKFRVFTVPAPVVAA